MEIAVEIEYPKKLDEISTANVGEPVAIDFRDKEYGFRAILKKNTTLFIVTFVEDYEILDHEKKERIASVAVELVNQCINRIRTFYHNRRDFIFISPRLVEKIKIQYTENGGTKTQYYFLTQRMPKYLKEYFDYLNEEEHTLNLSEKLEMDQVIFLHLIIDAYYSLYDGKFNDCIINCATATESLIFPIIKEWITNNLFHKNESSGEKILMEIPMSLKYELLFGSVKSPLLNKQERLLEKMKETNSLRNRIIHSGFQASRKQAESALNYSAKLIYILHFKVEDLDND